MAFNAFVWGNNAYGTAGLGYVGNLSSPTVWRTGATYKQIAYGGTTLSYIDENDLLWTSGNWTGNGTGNYYSSPVQTSVGGTWRYISNGNPLIGIKQDGTLWAWGFNYYGNVGNGGSNFGSDVYSPVQINASTNWIYTYSSVYCSFAINSLGQMYVWGTENNGQFGDGSSSTANYTPTLGPTNKSWTQVVSNIYGTTLALANDNTLWAWGQNAYGSCGQNTSGGLILNPVQIGSGTDWAKVLVSGYGCLALKNNGTLWAWGGVALFNSTTSYNSSPTQVSGTWLDAAATNNTVWAIKSNNTLWAAGGNGYSEQPLQPWTNTSSLIQIGSGITYKSFPTILGSAYGGLAYTDPNPTPTSSSSPSPSVTPSPTPSNSPSPTPSPTAMPNPTPTPTLIYNGNAIFGWGQSIYGLLANNTAVPGTSSPTLMFRTPNWITMPSVFNSAGALNTSRNLMVWGFNFYGELGTNNRINRSSAVQSVGTGPWAQVSMQHTGAGIKENGTIWTWGVNDNGQLGNNTAGVSPRSSPAQVGSATDWSSVSSGEYNGLGLEVYSAVLAIKNNGTMYGWGRNALGLIGDNSIISRSSPVLSTGTDWQRVETGYVSAVALKNDGTLWSVGANSNGQLGQGDKINRSSWTQIGTGTYIDIAAGRLSAAAIRSDGTLWAFGDNAYGQLARGNALDASSPVQIGTASDWVKVSASSLTVGAINSSGQLWMWGSNGLGQIGRNATAIANYSSPVQTVMTAYRYIDVKVGFQFVMAAVELPTLTPSPTPSPTPEPTPTAIAGQLYVWGDNQNGQLGLNTSIIDKSTPVQLASLSWIKISYDGTFAGITTAGTVWGCGYNFYGNLSTNNTINYSSLIQVGTAGVWTDIVTGSLTLHLIKNNGTLWGVGGNSTNGLIGNNAVINRSSLIQIGSAIDWTRFSNYTTNAGCRFAWRGNSLYAWGGNLSGMLGIGTAVNVSSPVLVDSTGTWSSICAASGTTSIGVKANGTLWVVGSNANGQLGLGNVINKSSWTQVGSGADWIAASASYEACAAIKNDGSLYAWGSNATGLIGQGSTSITNYSSPVRVGASNDWESVFAGSTCFRAQKKDGTLWVWGGNDNGVLGTNQSNAVSYSSPVQTVFQSTWASAYGGGLTNSFGFIVGPGPTTAPTVTPSATPSPTPSPSVTLSPTPSPSPSISPSPTPSPSPTLPSSPTPSPSPSRSPSPTPSPTLSPTATPSVTNSPTPSVTLSSTPSPTPSNSPSPTPSPSPTRSPSPTPSNSPSPTPSPSPSHSPSPTPSPSPSSSLSPTPSPSNSPSPTPSPSPSPSPSATATPLPSQSPFPTFTPQPTQSPQPTFTPQPTLSPVPTVTPLPTLTQDPTPTGSPTPFPTDTPQPTLTPVPTVTPFPTLTPLPTFTPFPTLTPQATPIYPVTNNYILVPYQNNMNTTNIVPSQEGYAFNNGGGSGINLLLQFMQNDPTPQQVFIELTNNSSTNMVITIGNIVYIVEPGEYFNTVALMPFGQKVTVQSQEPGNFTPSMVYGQIFLLPTPTPTPVERLQLQKCTIAVEGDAGSVDTALINCNSIQRTGYITITQNVTQVKVMEIPDGGIIDKTIQQLPAVIPLVCSGYLWVGEV